MKINIMITALLASMAVEAKVVTGTPFADNMVFQRGRAVPVWGTADAGEEVCVSFAGQERRTKADSKGNWRVELSPMEASRENRVLKVSGVANTEEIKNVLVGEVWFASGQSNMECPIWGGSPRYRDGQGAAMIASTHRPFIRYAKNGKAWQVDGPRLGWKAKWRDYSPASFRDSMSYNLSAVAFYYALEIHDALGVPVGIIDSSWGGTCIETWTPPCGHKDLARTLASRKRSHQSPTALWNGMVAAWAPFAIKGFIWYQGCSNAWQGRDYAARMHSLYGGWAKEFENPDLKLYFVQLAPFRNSWFEVQQGQAMFAREEKNAGMIVTCDIGNLHDIHPNDKETVGKRLALLALKRDYGFDAIVCDSPELKEWRIEGDSFVMKFDNANSWYDYNDDYSAAPGFEIAGANGGFKPAKLVNKRNRTGCYEGVELVVKADGVPNPRRLRYLGSKPWIGALYSGDSALPLGPFDIDARDPAEGRRDGAPSRLGDALKVPELAGFRTLYVADVPASGAFSKKNYVADNSAAAGSFGQVAYVMELVAKDGSADWAVAVMDAFSDDAVSLGVPAVSKKFFQQTVGDVKIRSNRKNVAEGTFKGSIEFFNSNYGTGRNLAEMKGSDKVYDINDTQAATGATGYGCLQIHNLSDSSVVMAYNNFNGSHRADIGIGNCEDGDNPDWTFAGNGGEYKARRLTVLVK